MSGVVAVVDDNAALLKSMQFLLGIEGHTVVAYSSAAAFLDDQATTPACLIVDQQMPGMTGLELVARLRQSGNALPVLLMSGLLSSQIVVQAADLGIAQVLDKPPPPEVLLQFVAAYC